MSWPNVQLINWRDPLALAACFHEQEMALLFSGVTEASSGNISYLAIDPIETCAGSDWDALPQPTAPSADAHSLPEWIGYLGYGMRENPPHDTARVINLPDFRFVRYRHLFRFTHSEKKLELFSRSNAPFSIPELRINGAPRPEISRLTSNFTQASYKKSVSATIARIHAGDFYQANITRKFFGEFAHAPDSFALFAALAAVSPAPYSAYIRHGASAILSASPECFLRIDPHGEITTRPIKGSARRSADVAEDAAIRSALKTSDKNNAENLMIVDLMRNDLARVSMPQSIEVTEQSGLYSYATIHHLISSIRAQKRLEVTAMEVIRACFPPGSMTGAPKIAAMRWCAAQEAMERGVYSGAIGWLGANNTCDLSVVIRTLIVEDKRFEFQVGGGIVADSTPEEEWQETLTKARGIATALGLKESDLAAL